MGFTDVQYLQNVGFSIEIDLKRPNHSSTDFYHSMKKIPTLTKISYLTPPSTGTRDFLPTPLMLFGKRWHVSHFHQEVKK